MEIDRFPSMFQTFCFRSIPSFYLLVSFPDVRPKEKCDTSKEYSSFDQLKGETENASR